MKNKFNNKKNVSLIKQSIIEYYSNKQILGVHFKRLCVKPCVV